MSDGDAILMFNFRGDRVREILTTFVDPFFNGFDRPLLINFSACTGFSNYSSELSQIFSTLFPRKKLEGILGKIISESGLTQLRIAETEKYAHVTYFFNGNRTGKFDADREDYLEIPSDNLPFEERPWMKAGEIADVTLEGMYSGK